MTVKPPNRYRKKLATTVSPDSFQVVLALCDHDRRGHFLDEAIHGYMTSCYWFNHPEHGGIKLREQGSFYHFADYNDQQQSPDFRTMTEALIWLKKSFPEANQINIQEDTGVKLL